MTFKFGSQIGKAAFCVRQFYSGDKKRVAWRIVQTVLAAACVVSVILLLSARVSLEREQAAFEELAAFVSEEAAQPAPISPEITTARPSETAPAEAPAGAASSSPVSGRLEGYRELHSINNDMIGWLKIDGTQIDYPVMYTPGDEERYLHLDFYGNDADAGCLFADDQSTFQPESDNIIIYGHNMKNGSMFAGLLDYCDEAFYKEHPVLTFDTLDKEQTYEILAVFRSQVFKVNDKVFKFYKFFNAATEAEFDDYVDNIKDLSLYDTGVTAEYGDKLVTLVTCAYHTENGRFVVVARKTQG